MRGLATAAIFLGPFLVWRAGAQAPPCDPMGIWVRSDKVETIEIYRTGSKLFGRLVASSEKKEKPGFILMRDFEYDAGKGTFHGELIAPSSGMEASGELTCTSDHSIRTVGHKLFLTKTFDWSRELPAASSNK